MATPEILNGKRVLVVEDEFHVALLLEDFLIEFGCIPVGPYSTVATALKALSIETLDLAVLDVNLGGEPVYPVAYALTERHLPFLLVSGYGNEAILPGHDDWTVCAKPFKAEDLAGMLAMMLDASNSGRAAFLAARQDGHIKAPRSPLAGATEKCK
jgi:DNA-binding NtrC family response regulator